MFDFLSGHFGVFDSQRQFPSYSSSLMSVPVSQEILQLGNFAAAALFPRKLCS